MRRLVLIGLCILLVIAYVERDRLSPFLPSQVAGLVGAQGARTQGGSKEKPPVAVTVAAAISGSLPIEAHTIGNLEPIASTVLTSQITGVISQVAVKDGVEVRAGDLVVTLDDRSAQALVEKDKAALSRDQATLDDANAVLRRVQSLVKSGADTQQAGDDALATVKQAEAGMAVDRAALTADEVALSMTELRAPFDGRIGIVGVSLGALIQPGTAVATITQMQPLYAGFSLPETLFDEVRAANAGSRLSVSVSPALGSTAAPKTGPVVFVGDAVDPVSATFKLRALVDNSGLDSLPGQSIDVLVHMGERGGLLLVPSVAVEPRDDDAVVYLVKPDGTVTIRPVEVALRVGDTAGITGGLSAGDRVVTEGQGALSEGTRVRIVKGPAPSAPDAARQAPSAAAPLQGKGVPEADGLGKAPQGGETASVEGGAS